MAFTTEDGRIAAGEALPHFMNANGRTFGEEEEQLVLEALRSGCLSRTGGSMVKRLEQEFAAMLGLPFAIACSSGTAAVHLCISALNLEPGDEVIVPPITDIGTILPILWQNAVPVFADIEPLTMTLDPNDVSRKISRKTRAIIAVHLAGQMCDMDSLRKLADEHQLMLIEDCSQAYWAEYKGNLAGTMGDMACFSLQQSKHVTCGEGGLMVTRNPEFARTAALFADKAWPRDLNTLGSGRFLFLAQNYRMSELQGAVALAQIRKVKSIVERRRHAAESLSALLDDLGDISAPHIPAETKHSYWLYPLRVAQPKNGAHTQKIGDALVAQGVPAWVRYIVDPLYLSPLFTQPATYGTSGYPFHAYGTQRFERGLCPHAEAALDSVIAIHWNENLNNNHVREMAAAIRSAAAQ
jgi:dTDP-4-amino-4,6-dideoxygalactose transaminase